MAASDGTTISIENRQAGRVLTPVPVYRMILLDALPPEDPHMAGYVWNNAGTPAVSAG